MTGCLLTAGTVYKVADVHSGAGLKLVLFLLNSVIKLGLCSYNKNCGFMGKTLKHS